MPMLTVKELRLAAACVEHAAFIAPRKALRAQRNELASKLRAIANQMDPEHKERR